MQMEIWAISNSPLPWSERKLFWERGSGLTGLQEACAWLPGRQEAGGRGGIEFSSPAAGVICPMLTKSCPPGHTKSYASTHLCPFLHAHPPTPTWPLWVVPFHPPHGTHLPRSNLFILTRIHNFIFLLIFKQTEYSSHLSLGIFLQKELEVHRQKLLFGPVTNGLNSLILYHKWFGNPEIGNLSPIRHFILHLVWYVNLFVTELVRMVLVKIEMAHAGTLLWLDAQSARCSEWI